MVSVTITNSVSGISYIIKNDATGVAMSDAVAGTGSNLTITSYSIYSAQTLKVFAINSTTGCYTSLTNNVTVGPAGLPIELLFFTAN